jgi:hypothetical protein
LFSGRDRQLLGDAHHGAARAGVCRDLPGRRPHRAADQPQRRPRQLAGAQRQPRRQPVGAGVIAQEALDDAVLQRMEADHHQTPSGPQEFHALRQR